MDILLIVLIVLLIAGVIPVWPHSQNWGYSPVGVVLVIVLILVLLRVL